MQPKTVDVHEVQTYLAELLSLVTAGVEVILTEGNTPLARIEPIVVSTTPRIVGLHPGVIWTSEDFGEPVQVLW